MGTYNIPVKAYGLAFDGPDIWVANDGANCVTKMLLDGTVVGTYVVGTDPTSVAFDGTHIWVTNSVSSTVTKLPDD